MCSRASEDHTPYKFPSGIELFTKSRSTPLLVLPLSKLIENTIKYIQNNFKGINLINATHQSVNYLTPMRCYTNKL